jgi:hypothetical protein
VQKRGVRHQDTASSLVVTNGQWMKHDGVLDDDNNGLTGAGTRRDGELISTVKKTRGLIDSIVIIPAAAGKRSTRCIENIVRSAGRPKCSSGSLTNPR